MGLVTRRERSECVPSQAETPLRLSAATTNWGGEPGFCFDTNDETESGQTPPKTGKGPVARGGNRSEFEDRIWSRV